MIQIVYSTQHWIVPHIVMGILVVLLAAIILTEGMARVKNGEPFEFAKDFCMYFPKDMDASVLAEYEAAMKKVTEDPAFVADMQKLYYNALSADEVGVEASKEFIYNKREMCKALIEKAPSLDTLTQ